MSSGYVGCLVSLDCGESLGTYQGQVKCVDNAAQMLTISKAFRNGTICEVPEITISACDIKSLQIIKSAGAALRELPKQATPSKLSKETEKDLNPVASPGRVTEVRRPSVSDDSENHQTTGNGVKGACMRSKERRENGGSYNRRALRTPSSDRGEDDGVSVEEFSSHLRHTPTRDEGSGYAKHTLANPRIEDGGGKNGALRHTPTKDEQFRTRISSASDGRCGHKPTLPRKIEFRKKSQSRPDCFSAPVDSYLNEFDFEKNLALFDKKAVFEEIESSQPAVVKFADKATKYRCDENVLQSGPVVLQQIKVPNCRGEKYVTDSGLVVPCIDYDLRNRLFSLAEGHGFSVDRRVEMIGRSASEMVLQLIGGSSRLNPQNGHQIPTVVVLCGPHIQGAQGLNCARHLVNHGVKVIVLLPNFMRMISVLEQELKLYDLCGSKRYSSIQDIPTCAVDMIVNCLYSHENSFLKEQTWYQSHMRWVKQSRAQVFTIDPPMETTDIVSKWGLCPVLPLAMADNSSQLYVCDLGLPKKVFTEVGITYKSPFGHKFIVAIHPQDPE